MEPQYRCRVTVSCDLRSNGSSLVCLKGTARSRSDPESSLECDVRSLYIFLCDDESANICVAVFCGVIYWRCRSLICFVSISFFFVMDIAITC